jgi:hypothetical protein
MSEYQTGSAVWLFFSRRRPISRLNTEDVGARGERYSNAEMTKPARFILDERDQFGRGG